MLNFTFLRELNARKKVKLLATIAGIIGSIQTIIGILLSLDLMPENSGIFVLITLISGFSAVVASLLLFFPVSNEIERTKIELLKSTQDAEKAAKAKSEFMTNMSHEIRTPLTAIIGNCNMIFSDLSNADQIVQCNKSTLKNAKYLKSLLDDLLDLSKITSGKFDVNLRKTNIENLITQVDSQVRSKAANKNQCFEILFKTPVPKYIKTDSVRMMQIILNLLGNSLKFTDSGGKIKLTLELDGGSTNHQQELVLEVIDNGIGIHKNKVDRLFKTFSQVDSSLTRSQGGSGLGLSLSRQLAKKLGGDLTLKQSAPGLGSIFELRLPIENEKNIPTFNAISRAKYSENEDFSSIKGQLSGKKILLVEDGEDNIRIFKFFLEMAGANLKIYPDGDAGYEGGKNESGVDLMLLDIQLPKLDGISVLSKLKAGAVDYPILALTAHSTLEEEEKCMRVGFDGFLSKPVDILELIRVCKEFCSNKTHPNLPSNPSNSLNASHSTSKHESSDIFEPLIIDFSNTLKERISKGQEAIENKDMKSFSGVMHQLSGAAATYGFTKLSSVASELEKTSLEVTQGKVAIERVLHDFSVLNSICAEIESRYVNDYS